MTEMMDVCMPEVGLNMMNQTCKVCGEPAAGFHFGAFTCEGCKSFFGRSYNNLSSISECKNNGKCIIDKKNRTTCKACRLRKCYTVGMSKGGSRYGRRSNWFKIHCLLQEQHQQAIDAANKSAAAASAVGGGNAAGTNNGASGYGDMAAAAKQHMQSAMNPHMAAVGGLLGYPAYHPHIPELMAAQAAAAPFMSAAGRHAADGPLPFFSMMPGMGVAPPAFQLPPHLLFPAAAAAAAYNPNAAAAAAAAADAAYRSEMYKHRQSVDSAASGDSGHRYSPQAAVASNNAERQQQQRQQQDLVRHSPELCVSGGVGSEVEDDELDVHSSPPPKAATQQQLREQQQREQQQQQQQQQHYQHTNHHQQHIISPVPIRATPLTASACSSPLAVPVPSSALTPNSMNSPTHQPSTPTPTQIVGANAESAAAAAAATALSFAAKMQSLSPVSVCSIGAESTSNGVIPQLQCAASDVTVRDQQECPMDLSMKAITSTSRNSPQSNSCHQTANNNNNGDCDMHCDSAGEEERIETPDRGAVTIDARRKYFHFSNGSEHGSEESDASSDAMGLIKRPKMIDEGYNSGGYASSHASAVSATSATSLHGIFVCV